MAEYFNYIGGQWVPSQSGRTYKDINPADFNDEVGQFPDSQPEDGVKAIEAAAEALAEWKSKSGPERSAFLYRTADLLESRADTIAADLTREEGKSLTEAKGETLRAVAILRYYAGEAWRAVGEVIPSANARNLLFTTRVPLGVVAVITPWNFPIAIPAWKIAPALAFGNTVVFKPASLTPLTAWNLVRAFDDAGLPPGVLNMVTGSGATLGETLLSHPLVKGISFTGSNEIGRQIGQKAAARNIKYQLEMGGKNPLIVAEDASLDQAVELAVRGAFLSAGQKCTATSRVIIEEPVFEEFQQKLLERVRTLKVGPGTDPSAFFGPLVSEQQRQKVLSYIQIGCEEGAYLLFGGGVPRGPLYDCGFYVEPTLFTHVKPEMRIAQEEIFGPVLCLMKARNLEEAIEIANAVPLGLSASLCTRNINRALRFVEKIEVGMVRINGETAGVEPQAPFGGMKESSSHSREQGRSAMEFFTEVKTVTIEPSLNEGL